MKLDKTISIGYEDFSEMIKEDCYYVDKTLFIKELIDNRSKVNLFTRPRRFGKTLTLSMLKYFFEIKDGSDGNALGNKALFENLNIYSAGEKYMEECGKYPVVFISLKDITMPDFDKAYEAFSALMANEYLRHAKILEADCFSENEAEKYKRILNGKASYVECADALKFLLECLEKYYGKKTVLLIDEYDVPIENAWRQGFYERLIDFIRLIFGAALKTNNSLNFAVITGCLRISKESIFTGLNNLNIISVLSNEYDEFFGFTHEEVADMLEYYGISSLSEEVREWYDGYVFGNNEIYNPWSIVNYVKDHKEDKDFLPRPYWSNTSSNAIVKELIDKAADVNDYEEIEKLINNGSIEKHIHEDITYEDIYSSRDNLWNFLFFTGYLKKVSERLNKTDLILEMEIPNKEVLNIYRSKIRSRFENSLENQNRNELFEAVKNGDVEKISNTISEYLLESISFYDYKEDYYHGFLAGLLKGFPRATVKSNRESGLGRYDIAIVPLSRRDTVYIFEVKVAESYELIDAACDAALDQIRERSYEMGFLKDGYNIVKSYGIAFYKKDCAVRN